MNGFLKLANVIEIESHHYGPENHVSESEQAHTKALRGASVRYVHAGLIDEVVPVTISIKDDEDIAVEINAVYLLIQHGGAVMDRNSAGPRDRDSWFLVPGTPETWLEKIAALQAEPEAPEAPDPVMPVALGYAFAESNTSILQTTVKSIDGFSQIEFRIRAGKDAKTALEIARPISVRVDTSSIPVGTTPTPSASLNLDAGPDVINVTRSQDGTTLYMLGQDNVRTFAIEIIGHE